MEYISLLPYSPDLNPIEQVWRITQREKTHNHYFCSLEKLTNTLDSAKAKCVYYIFLISYSSVSGLLSITTTLNVLSVT